MTTAKVKGLLAQLRDAANAIKAQIHEADAQIAALEEQRRALTCGLYPCRYSAPRRQLPMAD